MAKRLKLRLRRPEVTIHDLPDDMQEIEALDFSSLFEVKVDDVNWSILRYLLGFPRPSEGRPCTGVSRMPQSTVQSRST